MQQNLAPLAKLFKSFGNFEVLYGILQICIVIIRQILKII